MEISFDVHSGSMSLELPGFYRDPNTGRYYRQRPNDPHNRSSEGQRSSSRPIADDPLLYVSPKIKHVPNLLQCREYGLRRNSAFDSPFLKLKTKSLKLGEPERAINFYNFVDDIRYLKGGNESIFALWESSGSSSWLIIGEVLHYLTNLSEPLDLGVIQAFAGVVDFCDGFNRSKCFMSVSNDLATGQGRVQVIWRQPESEHIEEWSRSHSRRTTVWCCCSNSFVERFAVGCENAIGIDSALRNLFSRRVNGNVHSVHYNDMGNVLYCGLHTGKMNVVDLRSPRGVESENKLYDTGIDETVLLRDQVTLICGSFDGSLCKYDLRAMRGVTEYFGHVHTPRKVPFSVSESFNLLCATGSDNVTRLWSLNGGHPVKTIYPPEPTKPHRSWLISDAWSSKLYIIQNDQKYSCDI